MKTHGAWKLCSLALMLSGCGSAVSHDYLLPESTNEQPMFAQLRAQTVGYTDANRDRVRATFVWFPVLPAQNKDQTGQDLRLERTNVELLIGIPMAPPPRAVEQTGNTRSAYAELVLYEDRDNDNELDILPPNSKNVVRDRVLGRAEEFRIWWFDDAPASSGVTTGSLPKGRWLTTADWSKIENASDLCEPDRDGALGTFKPTCPPGSVRERLLPITEIPAQTVPIITLSNDPRLQSYGCLGFWGTNSQKGFEWPASAPGWKSSNIRDQICNPATCACNDAECPEPDLPVAGRPVEVLCEPTETSYYWKDCEPDPALCGTVFCHEGRGQRDPNQDRPKCSKIVAVLPAPSDISKGMTRAH